MSFQQQIKARLQAFGWHLLVSFAAAAAVALLVFGLWFPGAFRELAGGTRLLVLIMVVDVVMGPLLTFAVFDRRKSTRHLRRDIATIGVLQVAALLYGLYTVQLARPVALIFEHDRFRVVAAAEVLKKELPDALPEFRSLPWTGPQTMAVRRPESGEERNATLMTAIFDGIDTSQRPSFWIPYGPTEQTQALQVARPIAELIERYRSDGEGIEKALEAMRLSEPSAARFLPVVSRSDAVAVLDTQGHVVGFIMKDGFF
jgi:hypothetical protein